MALASFKQISNEASYLQAMLTAVQAIANPFLTPVQAARLVHQLNGLKMQLGRGQNTEAEFYRNEIELLLEQAYDVIGTVELTA